jgi:hypothetical protein
LKKKQGRLDRLQLSAAILAQWQHLVASIKALNLLNWEMRTVLYQCTATAIIMASVFGTFFRHLFVCFCPGSRWGNTEQVVAQWRRPVASGVALDILHWAMRLYHTGGPPWPSKWPTTEEHVDAIVDFIFDNNHGQIPCYGPLKLKLRHSNIYFYVISLLLCFGHLSTMMDAVSSTIFAGGQANINEI